MEVVHILDHYVIGRMVIASTALELVAFAWIYGESSVWLYNWVTSDLECNPRSFLNLLQPCYSREQQYMALHCICTLWWGRRGCIEKLIQNVVNYVNAVKLTFIVCGAHLCWHMHYFSRQLPLVQSLYQAGRAVVAGGLNPDDDD